MEWGGAPSAASVLSSSGVQSQSSISEDESDIAHLIAANPLVPLLMMLLVLYAIVFVWDLGPGLRGFLAVGVLAIIIGFTKWVSVRAHIHTSCA